MVKGFTPDEWNALTVPQRAKRCRDLASQAERLAKDARDEASRDPYLRLAAEWLQLAIEIET